MKKPIHEVAADVLAEQKRPMTADEIYEAIIDGGLYEFKSQSARSVLRNQLRRHSANISSAVQAGAATFVILPTGHFQLNQ